MRRRLAAALVVALPLAACSGAADSTEVLGTVVEATARATVTATPTPAPAPPTPAVTPATVSPTAPPATTPAAPPPATAPPAPPPATAPAPPVAAPTTPTSTPTPEPAPAVEHLDAGDGWSTNTLLPDEGGEAWTEVSGQAPVGPDGTSEARLFVTLAHDPVPGDSAGRLAHCRAWLEAAPAVALQAAGAVTVELLVGGETVRAETHPLDGVVPAGARADLPGFERPERVHALGGEAVTCRATYTPSG